MQFNCPNDIPCLIFILVYEFLSFFPVGYVILYLVKSWNSFVLALTVNSLVIHIFYYDFQPLANQHVALFR